MMTVPPPASVWRVPKSLPTGDGKPCNNIRLIIPNVVGGGPAGIGAALAAAKHGADTLLIENHGFFGGIASFTVGMCMNMMRPFGKPVLRRT